MAGSATITGRQNYILGIGHPRNQYIGEGAPDVFSENLGPSVSVTDFGAKCDGVTDDSTAVLNAQNYLNSRNVPYNGGIIDFPSGICIANIVMQSRIYLRGQGVNTTTIKSAQASSLDVLQIPKNAAFIGWQGITFDGNKTSGATGNGICFLDVNSGSYNTPLSLGNKTVSGDSPYKYCVGTAFAVVNCGNDGVQIGQATFGIYAVYLDSFHSTYNNGNGLVNYSTDNIIRAFYCEHNKKSGLLNYGSNMKFIGAKLIFCAENNPSYLDCAGLINYGSRCDFVAVESQDNYCDGAKLYGNDNTYDLLFDSNGYAQNNTNASSRNAYGFVSFSGERNVLKARITNYKGILLDGNVASEYSYRIDQGANFTKIDVDQAYQCSNKGVYLEIKKQYSNSDFIVCKRTSTVVHNGVTFTEDKPAIVQNIGVYLENGATSETIDICNEIASGFDSLSYVYEFKYTSSSGSAPVLIKSEDGLFAIYLIPGSNSFQIDLPINGLSNTVYLAYAAGSLVSGNTYRISGNCSIVGNSLSRTENVSMLDANNFSKIISTKKTDVLLAGEYKFGEIKTPRVAEAGQNISAIILAISIWSSNEKTMANLSDRAGSGVSNCKNDGIFVDFKNYQSNTKMALIRNLSVPVASDFYRGKIITTEASTGFDDLSLICKKNSSNVYSWQSLI